MKLNTVLFFNGKIKRKRHLNTVHALHDIGVNKAQPYMMLPVFAVRGAGDGSGGGVKKKVVVGEGTIEGDSTCIRRPS